MTHQLRASGRSSVSRLLALFSIAFTAFGTALALPSAEYQIPNVKIRYTTPSDWGAGFVANFEIINTGRTAIKGGWSLQFDFPHQITQIWNAKIQSQTGNRKVVTHMPYNADLAPGQSLHLGFLGAPGNVKAAPANVAFLGQSATNPPPAPAPLPGLSISDVSRLEGTGSTDPVTLVVRLSMASGSEVRVHLDTKDGTAKAGQDYESESAVISIPPGQTQVQVTIPIVGDAMVEPDETFEVLLSQPVNAHITRGVARVTLRNDDTASPPPTLPALTAGDVTVDEPASPAPTPAGALGFFRTQGNQIIDSEGRKVRIAGVSWFGFETPEMCPHGLWSRGYKSMLDQIKAQGFNTIRLPYCSQMLDPGSTARGIDSAANPELVGKTPLQVMDAVIEYAGQIGLRIFLDHHRSDAGAGPNGNGLWFTDRYPESRWINDWRMLAQRYRHNPTVVGADLANEPHNGQWGGGGANDWPAAAERAGNAILAVHPDWLIIVEGVGQYQGANYWWGGMLAGVRDRPVRLNVSNRVVYSPHDYANSVYPQPWFSAPDFPRNLFPLWRQTWGFIYEQNLAPVLLGEFGTKLQDPKDVQWAHAMMQYLGGDLDGNGSRDIPTGNFGISWTWWSWNPNSGDTGGILKDDWISVHTHKVDLLRPHMFAWPSAAGGGGTSGGSVPVPSIARIPVTLDKVADGPITVGYATVNGTAVAGQDFISKNGTLTFFPGQLSQTVEIEILPDSLAEPDESFILRLSNPIGATLAKPDATAKIRNTGG
jgi:aryl-phospho-beta-D-glucosidase BglC (GH1 family)